MKAAHPPGALARHVPNEIFQVAAVPRTLSGKKLELPVKTLCWASRSRGRQPRCDGESVQSRLVRAVRRDTACPLTAHASDRMRIPPAPCAARSISTS